MGDTVHRPEITGETKSAVEELIGSIASEEYDVEDESFESNLQVLVRLTLTLSQEVTQWQQSYYRERQTAQAAIHQLNQQQNQSNTQQAANGVPIEDLPNVDSIEDLQAKLDDNRSR